MTAAAAALCSAGIERIRAAQARYPEWVTVGPFSPPALFHAFHARLGAVPLAVLLLACVAAAWRWPRQRRAIAFMHLLVLAAAVVVHGLALHWALAVFRP